MNVSRHSFRKCAKIVLLCVELYRYLAKDTGLWLSFHLSTFSWLSAPCASDECFVALFSKMRENGDVLSIRAQRALLIFSERHSPLVASSLSTFSWLSALCEVKWWMFRGILSENVRKWWRYFNLCVKGFIDIWRKKQWTEHTYLIYAHIEDVYKWRKNLISKEKKIELVPIPDHKLYTRKNGVNNGLKLMFYGGLYKWIRTTVRINCE